jgi:cytochrome d ubiquinol oxidase subunit I
LASFWAYLLNPWAIWQYAHNMSAAVITGSFVVAAVGAFYTLMGRHKEHANVFLKVGVYTGLIFSVLQVFPTGDGQGKLVARHQPITFAAMEGRFQSGPYAEIAIIGQPDVARRQLENPIYVPGVLSYLAYGEFSSNVQGLNDFPKDQWPDNVELLYFAYHIMVGLGTIFILLMGAAAVAQHRGRLQTSRPLLWLLMLAFPFPYIATTFGWMSAELGRQPWLVYGLQRTIHGTSEQVSGGNVAFSTLGFMGLYLVVGVLFLYLVMREVERGPTGPDGVESADDEQSQSDPA